MLQKSFSKLIILMLSVVTLNCASFPDYEVNDKSENLQGKLKDGARWAAWEQTAAISFSFLGSDHIFWDKKRNMVEVAWSSWGSDYKVQFSQKPFVAEVWVDNEIETDREERSELVKKAYKLFINHTFWFNPAFHIFSDTVEKGITENGELTVVFSSGGVTPGDKYLFSLDEEGKIKSMRMWVSIVPFKGLNADFEDYVETDSGLIISTNHSIGFFNLDLQEVKSYSVYPNDKDRFAMLLSKIEKG